MSRTLIIALLIFSSCIAVVNETQAVEDPVFNPQLSGALQKALEKVKEILNTDNVSASLYISDRCQWEGATGVTVQDPDIAIDSDTIYGFGSITKTFVAGIVLQLVEEKKLGLEDPLGKWLPQYPGIDAKISVAQLLNHGSGLSDYYGSKRHRSEVEANPDRVWLPEEILKIGGTPRNTGSTPPRYSNTNYILLGMIIEAITGNSLEYELQNRITDPLQLDSTYLPKQDFNPERWADSTMLSSSLFSSVWAAGAIASIPRDIAKWSQALHSGNFLQTTTLELMRVAEPRRIGRRAVIPMGLGVWKIEKDGKIAWGHGGRFRPFLSATFYMPNLDLSVASTFNWSDGSGQLTPASHLVRTYIENKPQDISMCFDS